MKSGDVYQQVGVLIPMRLKSERALAKLKLVPDDIVDIECERCKCLAWMPRFALDELMDDARSRDDMLDETIFQCHDCAVSEMKRLKSEGEEYVVEMGRATSDGEIEGDDPGKAERICEHLRDGRFDRVVEMDECVDDGLDWGNHG